MHRVLAATISLLLLASVSVSAASAQQQSGVSTAGAKTSKSAPPDQPTAVTVASRLSSMAVGSVVGIPICMVRRIQAETVIATKELVGENNKHKCPYVIAAPLGFVGGGVSGVFQGIVYAPYHAYKYSDQPFSKEVFSLGDEK